MSYRRDRGAVEDGGGVIILVKSPLVSEQICSQLWTNLELVVCRLHFGSKTVIVACIYRPPESTKWYNTKISEAIEQISDLSADQYIICGDFNYSKINWSDMVIIGDVDSNSSTVSDEKRFYDAVQNSFLFQHVDDVTRQRGADSPSRLDLVFSKNQLEIEYIDYQAHIGRSDHCVLVFDFALEGKLPNEDRQVPKLNVYKGKFPSMSNIFLTWQDNLNPGNPQAKWDMLIELYNDAVSQYVPLRRSSGGIGRNKWMTSEALKAIETKKRKYKLWRKNRTETNLGNLRRATNASVKAVNKAKYNFEKSIAEEVKNGDTASFYAYLKSTSSIKEEVSRVVRADGSLTQTLKETVDVMNSTFQSVFVKEGDGAVPGFAQRYNGVPLDDIDFTVQDIENILIRLKQSSAPGPCSIHSKVLKECAGSLALPLYSIFRDSLDTGIVPKIWKTAYVSPIYKKGKKSEPLNYRPISLTSVPCKVMERVLRENIMDHLESNNLLSSHQHGFRSNRSCLTQLLEYFLEIHEIIDERDPVDAIYLDCQKAFDTVPLKRLLVKLEAYGITGKILNWIKSFLLGRTQRVVVKGEMSDVLDVWSGVPQGSVLGPLLFLIYINDLLDEITSKGKLFADDSKLFRKINSWDDCVALQSDLLKLQEWSSTWL